MGSVFDATVMGLDRNRCLHSYIGWIHVLDGNVEMIVIVTGSREFTDEFYLYEKLLTIRQVYGSIFVVVGDCPTGADYFAKNWCVANGQEFKEFKANWERPCTVTCFHAPRFKNGKRYCAQAGHYRNQEMIDWAKAKFNANGVVCLGFYKEGARNRGTSDCCRRAKAAYIPVTKHWEKGVS